MPWFAMGVYYDDRQNFVWPIFRDYQIVCNGHTRGTQVGVDQILDQIRYDDFLIAKSFSPKTGICLYGLGKVIGMNTYHYPIPKGYDNQCIRVNWIIRSDDNDYVVNFPNLVGGNYSQQVIQLNFQAEQAIRDWLLGIGIRV